MSLSLLKSEVEQFLTYHLRESADIVPSVTVKQSDSQLTESINNHQIDVSITTGSSPLTNSQKAKVNCAVRVYVTSPRGISEHLDVVSLILDIFARNSQFEPRHTNLKLLALGETTFESELFSVNSHATAIVKPVEIEISLIPSRPKIEFKSLTADIFGDRVPLHPQDKK